MGHIGFGELVLILLIILVIFGAGKLPQVMKSLGEGMSSFKKAAQDDGQKPSPSEEAPAADTTTDNAEKKQ